MDKFDRLAREGNYLAQSFGDSWYAIGALGGAIVGSFGTKAHAKKVLKQYRDARASVLRKAAALAPEGASR